MLLYLLLTSRSLGLHCQIKVGNVALQWLSEKNEVSSLQLNCFRNYHKCSTSKRIASQTNDLTHKSFLLQYKSNHIAWHLPMDSLDHF